MNGYVFYGLIDFYPNKENIKEIYNNLTKEEKKIYKMYVYSLPFMEDNIKDLIWEYLNGWEETLFELSKKYREQIIKNEKRLKKYEISDNDEVR